MRTVAGLLNIVLGVVLVVVVAIVINLDYPANVIAWIVGGLLAVAGIAVLARAPWGPLLGQWLGIGGILLGLALVVGAAVALVTTADWGGLVGAVLLALGVPVLLASVLAFLANRRARHSSPEL